MATQIQITGAALLFGLYAAVVLFFVIRGALKTKSISDYAVGNMNFSPVFVGLSFAAATTSAATFVLNPGFVANYGLSAFLSYGVFFPLATITSFVALTKSFRKFGQSVNAVSLAGWVGSRYGSKGYALFVAFLSALLITFIVLILVALTKVIASALNANELAVLATLTVFTFGYMMFGGANSMVYTNAIQASIMIVVAVILIFSGIKFFNEGFAGFFDKLFAINPALVKPANPTSLFFHDFYEIAFAQIIVGIAVVCQPHIITKSLLLKKESDVNKYLLVGGVVQLLFFLVVVAGFYARLQFPDGLPNDEYISKYVVSIFAGGTGALIIGLVATLGLISAGFSTVEGLIQSLGTTITTDIIKPLFNKKIKNDKKYITINRVVIAVMGIVAFLISCTQLNPRYSVAIFAQNGVYAYFSIIFTPVLFGIFVKNVSLKVPITGSVTALIVYFSVYYLLPAMVNSGIANFGYLNNYLQGQVHNPAIAASTAIVLSVAAGITVHKFCKKKQ
ncbi:MAG: hypothetical protein LBS01_10540 [Prevotellaceae bacterium]|jgi:sodium/pantothenate symporter|nr:hypothetical protein [Prevotellaceae bacterium]